MRTSFYHGCAYLHEPGSVVGVFGKAHCKAIGSLGFGTLGITDGGNNIVLNTKY